LFYKVGIMQSERKESLDQSNDGLTPEPPRIVKNLLWYRKYGLKHWKLLLLAGAIILAGFILSKPDLFSRNSKILQKTFNFANFEDAELRHAIEESSNLKFDMSDEATYKIKFTHTGNMRPSSHEGYYLFEGGVAVVMINESKCCEINEIKLGSWADNPGNPKYLLEAEIEKDLKKKIIENRKLVVECISKCLKNEN
jgi:hypothetical protein